MEWPYSHILGPERFTEEQVFARISCGNTEGSVFTLRFFNEVLDLKILTSSAYILFISSHHQHTYLLLLTIKVMGR
jgi:hypothetical protein